MARARVHTRKKDIASSTNDTLRYLSRFRWWLRLLPSIVKLAPKKLKRHGEWKTTYHPVDFNNSNGLRSMLTGGFTYLFLELILLQGALYSETYICHLTQTQRFQELINEQRVGGLLGKTEHYFGAVFWNLLPQYLSPVRSNNLDRRLV